MNINKKRIIVKITLASLLFILSLVLLLTESFNIAIPFNITLEWFNGKLNIVSVIVLVGCILIALFIGYLTISLIKDKLDTKPCKIIQTIYEYFSTFIVAIDFVYLIFVFICFPVKTAQTSMMPTIQDGQRLLVSVIDKNYERGDIVVFSIDSSRLSTTNKDGELWLKRVIGLPGEKIEFVDGRLIVNGAEVFEEYLLNEDGSFKKGFGYDCELNLNYKICQTLEDVLHLTGFEGDTIPDGYYLLLGDNRANSCDSWSIGVVPKDLILGTVHYAVNNIFVFKRIN